MIKDLIKINRSFRRFYEDVPVRMEELLEMADCARLSSSGRNLQPLKYFLSLDPLINKLIFPNLAWAGYLKDWKGPEEGERPSAYIVMLGDREITTSFGIDPGIAAQSILLCAREKGLGGCIIASVNREKVREILNIDEKFEILYVIALGKPKETVVLEELSPEGDIKYWRDSNSVHHVPKRSLDEVIIGSAEL